MKILILSASTGGGHMRASSALKSYIVNNSPDAVVEIVDTLEYISPLLNKTVTEGYLYLATKTPKLYGTLYKTTNRDKVLSSMVFRLSNLFNKPLIPLLEDFEPDVIITTHPFPTEMISNLKEVGIIDIPLICIMTDYAPHKTWINKRVDSYIVSNEGMVDVMVEMGAKRELIHPFGIPIDNSFYTKKDKAAILTDMGLDPQIPTILIMAGSFGVTNILRIYNNIVKIDVDFQVIVITGKNQRLYEAFNRIITKSNQIKPDRVVKISTKIAGKAEVKTKIPVKLKAKPKKNTKLLYFTNEVDKYMQIADLIITKPGGLTVSEALACNLPMAIFDAIPGQEEENADFLIDNNMAVKIQKGVSCADSIRSLLSNRQKLEEMKQSCQTFDKSNSSENIFLQIKKLTEDAKKQKEMPLQ